MYGVGDYTNARRFTGRGTFLGAYSGARRYTGRGTFLGYYSSDPSVASSLTARGLPVFNPFPPAPAQPHQGIGGMSPVMLGVVAVGALFAWKKLKRAA